MPWSLWATRERAPWAAACWRGPSRSSLFGEEIAGQRLASVNFQGLSSHADRDHLLQWIDQVKDPAPQQIFVVHGDAQVTEIFANTLRREGPAGSRAFV